MAYTSITDILVDSQDVDKADLRAYLKNREVVHINDYGAVGDGVTDDTAAWEAARDALGDGGVLVFSAGKNYLIDYMDVSANIALIGAGRQNTKITITGFSTDAVTGKKYGLLPRGLDSDGLAAVVRMQGIEFLLTTAEADVHGALIRRKQYWDDVYINGATGDGLHFHGEAANLQSFFSYFLNVWAKNCGGHGCNLGRGANANIFFNYQFDSNGGDGIHHETDGTSTYNNLFFGGQASYNGLRGANFVNGTNIQLYGHYGEFNGEDLTAPDWKPSTGYTVGDLITSPSAGLTDAQTGVIYECVSNHTSDGSSFETDYDAGRWKPYGTDVYVGASCTWSQLYIGTVSFSKTHNIANECLQITTKVCMGGFYIAPVGYVGPLHQKQVFRDGYDVGVGASSVTTRKRVSGGGKFTDEFYEGASSSIAQVYDGTAATPGNKWGIETDSDNDGTRDVYAFAVDQRGCFGTEKYFTVATAPAAANHKGKSIYVEDGAAGQPVMAFSDGTNWLRYDSRTPISAT